MPPHDLLVLFPPLGVSPFSSYYSTRVQHSHAAKDGWGSFYKSCTLSELDDGLVQSFLYFLSLSFSWFIVFLCASIGMSMLCLRWQTPM